MNYLPLLVVDGIVVFLNCGIGTGFLLYVTGQRVGVLIGSIVSCTLGTSSVSTRSRGFSFASGIVKSLPRKKIMSHTGQISTKIT